MDGNHLTYLKTLERMGDVGTTALSARMRRKKKKKKKKLLKLLQRNPLLKYTQTVTNTRKSQAKNVLDKLFMSMSMSTEIGYTPTAF